MNTVLLVVIIKVKMDKSKRWMKRLQYWFMLFVEYSTCNREREDSLGEVDWIES